MKKSLITLLALMLVGFSNLALIALGQLTLPQYVAVFVGILGQAVLWKQLRDKLLGDISEYGYQVVQATNFALVCLFGVVVFSCKLFLSNDAFHIYLSLSCLAFFSVSLIVYLLKIYRLVKVAKK
ncbi:MAG: hypothetical protein SOY59_09275 [Ligilactobacillus agilis]|nr:hypothetical protein [Ligilactobacillus agilis]MDY4065815.1 hypothetical protein [Ligilactobacillus agilis]